MSYQQVIVEGRLGKDPEAKYAPSGTAVTKFSVATEETWKNAAGEQQKKTVWFNVTCWGKLAETMAQYLAKGREVLVIGRMEPVHTWMVEGVEHVSKNLDVTAATVKFVGSKPDGAPTEASAEEPVAEDEIPF